MSQDFSWSTRKPIHRPKFAQLLQTSQRLKAQQPRLNLICRAEAASFPSPANNRGRGFDYGKAWQQKTTEQGVQRPPLAANAQRPRPGPTQKPRPEKGESVSSSLFVDFGSLPPDGRSITTEEETCDPMEQRCKTAVHVWEMKCKKCYGTGILTLGSRRGGRHSCTCLACHGLGFVRQASTQRIPDLSDGAYTIARDQ